MLLIICSCTFITNLIISSTDKTCSVTYFKNENVVIEEDNKKNKKLDSSFSKSNKIARKSVNTN